MRTVVAAALIAASLAAVPPAGMPPTLETVVAGNPTTAERFRLPLDGPPLVSRRFDPPSLPWGRGHRGVDLQATVPGVTVYAAGAGTVSHAGRIVDRGVVSISHPGGFRTTYEPVDTRLPVGATVVAGTPIGVLADGHPGCPASACLHWGLRQHDGGYLDPLLLLGDGRTRLLPTHG
ncbi:MULTISPECIES: peptidoglycan DD-metalloendopeptidase family protein [unclassified Solwaraspora]|uniref:peptidoglycan DD-metalloendopeptidase family protein n=1 Tax=unclassified Solwaraspora TaxID=2627926 RepID=UPI00259B3C93|nr:peptidoglycan DD-metalloendopeptidase family protein [Solwaraspora sp. WMMA2056]WJK40008.1 peptidoglycan DD-metalloendopeptidase family protein [Solwaraspora sp. WMMA2056]